MTTKERKPSPDDKPTSMWIHQSTLERLANHGDARDTLEEVLIQVLDKLEGKRK
jgi:hypothetical protein